jgi:hypothetical protein
MSIRGIRAKNLRNTGRSVLDFDTPTSKQVFKEGPGGGIFCLRLRASYRKSRAPDIELLGLGSCVYQYRGNP